MEFEVVIGLEVHAQLLTKSKMFSSSANQFGAETNTVIDPICTGQPGTLPVINQYAIELGIRAALALGCKIHTESVFARKHYFYPDLPKGYQISQYDKPYCTEGHLEVRLKTGESKRLGIQRIHFEEDAGKSVHSSSGTLVNLNRAGVPLIEIVSHPDMRSAHEAGQYLRTLRSILQYAEVCDGNMEQGNFRCDANISLRPRGEKKFGTKVELKNINSFRFVEKAIEFEIDRQSKMLRDGLKIAQETRSWNSAKNISETLRSKEEAQDYRYFPEPDLPVLVISESWQQKVKESMPELPEAMKQRFQADYGLTDYDASVLTSSKELARYYEVVSKLTKNPKTSANWVMNELLGKLNEAGKEIESSPVSSEHLAELIQLMDQGKISSKMAKDIFEEMLATSEKPSKIVEKKGLVQLNDPAKIEEVVRKVVEANPKQFAEYKAGKVKLMAYFVGQTMKETKGQANPALLNEIVKKILDS